jgi:hypothetical protein
MGTSAPAAKQRLFAYPTRPASYAAGGAQQIGATQTAVQALEQAIKNNKPLSAAQKLLLQELDPGSTYDPSASATASGTVSASNTAGTAVTDPISAAVGTVGNVVGGEVNAVKSGVSVIGAISNFVSNPVPALLTIVFVLGGALMVFSGAGKMLGFDTPLKSTLGKLPVPR